ncbi:hypothetical protein MKZ38_006965 [Zalerion maritima]|uniref:Uncharacterized protein n=1 Tax=Zalerion maritima TaxID=339359 RepID=A0AAD5RIG7_9PEZI|nr:hypothetical protein MKZ38_006965 [Zalerion maritima]
MPPRLFLNDPTPHGLSALPQVHGFRGSGTSLSVLPQAHPLPSLPRDLMFSTRVMIPNQVLAGHEFPTSCFVRPISPVEEFLHPGYPDGENVLLVLPAHDSKGIHYDTALIASSLPTPAGTVSSRQREARAHIVPVLQQRWWVANVPKAGKYVVHVLKSDATNELHEEYYNLEMQPLKGLGREFLPARFALAILSNKIIFANRSRSPSPKKRQRLQSGVAGDAGDRSASTTVAEDDLYFECSLEEGGSDDDMESHWRPRKRKRLSSRRSTAPSSASTNFQSRARDLDHVHIAGSDHEESGSGFMAGETDKNFGECDSISPLLEKWEP